MGKRKKQQPERLSKKLFDIREFFNFSQQEMVGYIIPTGRDVVAARAAVSDYERGRRTPSLLELLQYARSVRLFTRYKNFTVEDLINDHRSLPWQIK